MYSRRCLVSIAALFLLAAACGSEIASEASSGAQATVTTVRVAADPGPLGFRHPAVGGGEIDFATMAGTPVALWFWAPG